MTTDARPLLYIWKTGAAKTVHAQPTVVDLLALKQGSLFIFRCEESGFERLMFSKESFVWVGVEDADILRSGSFRFHT